MNLKSELGKCKIDLDDCKRKLKEYKKENERLKQGRASLRRKATQELGIGYWGLKEKSDDNISHEEIVFLFAKIHDRLGFQAIRLIQTPYPDCIAIKDNEEKRIEFEVKTTDFYPKHRGAESSCNYIICWVDDKDTNVELKETLEQHNIEVIELKSWWQKTHAVKKIPKNLKWTKDEIRELPLSKLIVLKALTSDKAENNNYFLTKNELSELACMGKALGAAVGKFKYPQGKEELVKAMSGGYNFNSKYLDAVKAAIKEIEEINPDKLTYPRRP